MVEVIQGLVADHCNYGGGAPEVHIHHIERNVFGNSIAIKVYGELHMAARERVWAREMKLKTIQVLDLTVEVPHQEAHGYMANKHIYHKGEYDNYASIDIFDDAGTAQTAGNGPYTDGSIWLDFIALGE
jgi:hypothetical protein